MPGRRGRPEANCPSRAFCDYRFRCVHGCEGGLGRGGRGFRHARHVPCVNAEEHLRHSVGVDTSDWLIHLAMFPRVSMFYQSEQECEAVQSNLALIRPGGTHWCAQCAAERSDPPPPAPKRRRRTEAVQRPRERPLENHVGRRPPCEGTGNAVATRDRVAQLQWCTGKYHCPVCLPKGQTRRLGSKQCTDLHGHVPHGVGRKEVVHVRPVGAAASQLTDAQLAAIPPEEMCELCHGGQ